VRDLLKLKLLLPAVAACLVLAACGSSSSKTTSSTPTGSAATGAAQTTGSGVTVRMASSSLGTILVNAQGMTLYHLSAEQGGKFICTTAACTGIWHPLAIAAGSTPSGTVGSLGTIKRPDGTTQVTYKGAPLYTFAQDHKAGETSGQGIKDVGTWSAVTTGSSTAPSSTQTTEKSGGGYAY
jgi:predicted lipoprotein with Yx(FWY)xxD motif